MTHTFKLRLLVASLLIALAEIAFGFDETRLDQDDQRLLAELNASEVIQALEAKAATDNALSSESALRVVPLLKAAQSKGLPLGAFLYPDWINQDEMRRVIIIEFKRSFFDGGIDWKYVPALIDSFLAARDSPPSIYFNSKYTYREQEELLGLEQFFRDTILDNIYALAYPDKSKRPPRTGAGADGGNAPTLKRMLEAILASSTAALSPANRAMLQKQLIKADAFIANPPPLPVASWREAAAKEQVAKDELARPVRTPSPTKNDQPLPTARTTSTSKQVGGDASAGGESRASTSRTLWAVMILAAIGLLWILLKKRK